MTLLLSLLLLFPQQPVDSSRVEQLEQRIDQLESRMERQEVSKQYFEDVVDNQRWTFGIGLAVTTAIFGFIGWGIFEWRAGNIEDNLENKLIDLESKMDYKISDAKDDAIEISKAQFKTSIDKITDNTSDIENLQNDIYEYLSEHYNSIVREYRIKESLDTLEPIKIEARRLILESEVSDFDAIDFMSIDLFPTFPQIRYLIDLVDEDTEWESSDKEKIQSYLSELMDKYSGNEERVEALQQISTTVDAIGE
jgi:hypothetical protein